MGTLDHVQVFERLGPAGKALLDRGTVRITAQRQQSLLYKGQSISGAYVVIDGCLRVYTISPSGTEATLYTLAPGETCVLALNSLFNDLRYPAWVEAQEDSSIAFIPGNVYRSLFATEASVRDLTVRALSTLTFRLIQELEVMHSGRNKDRLAHFLLHHATNDGTIRMTQQRIAQHLGTTREVVTRLIGELADAGLVETARGRIVILDCDRLTLLASPGLSLRQEPRSCR
ncbi:cAMP-binding protein [Pseudoxanthomonas kalamensis DSM 18571]|uniref:Crp/Fnr family transcriptional regulator n=1 Tax=Pseudoxanthomonas kalamensis TaxID=289483 RepID=UPI00139170F7|nr:Crp/Fnr family transcriptional regulator [Pseudoxanthomonas kalamensis]KAF1709249.1 cAMP-binding protein [Pseudoxanthomonas kalamensis DSM 18571]